MKNNQKMFVVQKYIMAASAKDALKKEKNIPPDECYIDAEWKKGNATKLAGAIGFNIDNK